MSNLFGDNTDTVPTIDETKDWYAELVGEGKKYKDNAALALSKVHGDAAIQQREKENNALRQELETLRKDLDSRKTIEDFMDNMNKRDESNHGNQPNEPVNGPTLTTDEINEIVESRLTALQKQSLEDRNFNEVIQILEKNLGPDFASKLEAKAKELELGKDFLNNLAKTSPKAFLSVLGISETESQNVFSTPKTTINSNQNFKRDVKNYAYYQKLKQTMKPEEYWSPKVQNEMMKQAVELGDDFYN